MDEMKILRMNLLGGFNEYILNLGDEEEFEEWYQIYPDGATEEDLAEIAEDEQLWSECCRVFWDIVYRYTDED